MHDTVRAVLRDPAFHRSLRRSLADRLLVWMAEWFDRLLKLFQHAPSARSIALVFAGLIALFVIVRLLVGASARDASPGRGARRRGAVSAEDPWAAADALVAAGLFEEAAHALYRGVILSLGRRERLRLDPARTSGDYARELRRRSAASLVPFRAFTRRFDVVVYGHDGATAASVAELRELSRPFRTELRAA